MVRLSLLGLQEQQRATAMSESGWHVLLMANGRLRKRLPLAFKRMVNVFPAGIPFCSNRKPAHSFSFTKLVHRPPHGGECCAQVRTTAGLGAHPNAYQRASSGQSKTNLSSFPMVASFREAVPKVYHPRHLGKSISNVVPTMAKHGPAFQCHKGKTVHQPSNPVFYFWEPGDSCHWAAHGPGKFSPQDPTTTGCTGPR